MMKNYFVIIAIGCMLAVISCKKEDKQENIKDEKGTVSMSFENVVGDQPLILNTGSYTNANGDTFNVSLYKYYVSNIILVKDDGSEYAEPESYHLINQEKPTSYSFMINEVPSGKYTSIKLMLGVDSTHNVRGAQTNALDPINGMFWTWSTGYIMAKIEGKSPQSGAFGKSIIFHLGGFSGKFSSVKEVALPFSKAINVSKQSNPEIYLQSDILAWFTDPFHIDFNTTYSIMEPGTDSKKLADNYANMLSIKKIEQ